MNTATKTLSPGYTRNRPVRRMTSTVRDILNPLEFLWVSKMWCNFEGGPEDYDFSVIYELTTPITNTRVWVVDRDGPESEPMLMLPEDY